MKTLLCSLVAFNLSVSAASAAPPTLTNLELATKVREANSAINRRLSEAAGEIDFKGGTITPKGSKLAVEALDITLQTVDLIQSCPGILATMEVRTPTEWAFLQRWFKERLAKYQALKGKDFSDVEDVFEQTTYFDDDPALTEFFRVYSTTVKHL
ncbi:hypothetical protein K2X33_07300 [bacterium]|nr:hypothetical protein [bacterium]